MEVTDEGLARFFEVVLPHMNEVQRRVVGGAMAEMLGRGGKSAVATASGMSRNTVIKAQAEVESGIEPSSRLRAPGGGDKPLIDKQTMDEMKQKAEQAPPPPPAQQQPQTPEQPKPQPTQPLPPNPQSQAPDAPHPQAVPAKPNFAMGPQNPADQLRHDMQSARPGQGQPNYGNQPSGGSGLARHPGAGSGYEVLSDTQGVDFSSWLSRWHYITQMTWDPLIPDEVNPPILKSGIVAVRFKVLPNGQVTDMQLDGRSGDTGLDRAAWGAITGSSYPPLPREFHGPYLELRAYFLYNQQPQ